MNFIIQEIKNQNKISSIKFIINSIENPLTLYLLELTEVEFQKISEEQKILINFENLANFEYITSMECKNYFTRLSEKFHKIFIKIS